MERCCWESTTGVFEGKQKLGGLAISPLNIHGDSVCPPLPPFSSPASSSSLSQHLSPAYLIFFAKNCHSVIIERGGYSPPGGEQLFFPQSIAFRNLPPTTTWCVYVYIRGRGGRAVLLLLFLANVGLVRGAHHHQEEEECGSRPTSTSSSSSFSAHCFSEEEESGGDGSLIATAFLSSTHRLEEEVFFAPVCEGVGGKSRTF